MRFLDPKPFLQAKEIVHAGLAFFALTSLTIAWSRFSGGLALVWPGTAILVATLLPQDVRKWFPILTAFALLSWLATALFGFGPKVAVPLAIVNVFEGFVITTLMLALRPQRDWLESVSGLQRMIVSVVLGTSLSALPGSLLAHWMVGESWKQHGLEWLVGHGLGTFLFFPLALMISTGVIKNQIRKGSARETIECSLHCASIAVVCAMAFFQDTIALLYLPVVPLMYASFRCGRIGAVLGVLIVATFGAVSLSMEQGFFRQIEWTLAGEVQLLQLYLAILLMLALPTTVALKQHKLLLAELREKRALECLVSDHTDDVLLNLDPRGHIRYCSQAGHRLSGGEDVIGEPLTILFDPLDQQLVRMTLVQAKENPETTRTLERAVIRDDEVVWLDTKLQAVPNPDLDEILGYAVTIRDVTNRKLAEIKMRREAETDTLTGLANRRALLRHLEPRLCHAEIRPFFIVLIDLDFFKVVNDNYGHVTGDQVLVNVARAMCKVATPECFIGRLGGEEFAIVAEGLTLTNVIELCEELRAAIAKLQFDIIEDADFRVTASLGVAAISSAMTPAEALSKADQPLYAAKARGRNRTEIAGARNVAQIYPLRVTVA